MDVATWFCLFVIGYHYAGYPALLWLLARLRPRPTRQGTALPAISLIIAAYNEADVIAAKAENSLALDYPPDRLEIIFVTDGSDDGTADVAATYAAQGVRLLHQSQRQGKSAAINRAAAQANGDILVFSDANAFYLPDALRLLVRHFADPQVGGVSGQKTIRRSHDRRQPASGVSDSSSLYWRYESAIKRWESAIGSTVGVVGEMMAVRRALFQPIPVDVINDDAYLAVRLCRAGARVVYEPAAVCWETAAESNEQEQIRRRRITAGRFQLLFRPRLWPWRSPWMVFALFSHKFLRLLLPFFLLGALVSSALAVWRGQGGGLLQLALAGQLAVGALAAWGAWQERTGRRGRMPALAYFLLSSNWTTLQGLVRYLRGQQTVLWQKAQRERLPE
ncbi:MAG: glycosyltransferase family 2 protein [Candidatus Promineifilaceae bacterium]